MKIRHAFTGHVYELLDDGTVRVTDPATGDGGVFTADAEWVSGAIRVADFHLCRHVGGAHADAGGLFPSRR